ncbi:hypothetical protein ACLOJK_002562 [Asimina triloba]
MALIPYGRADGPSRTAGLTGPGVYILSGWRNSGGEERPWRVVFVLLLRSLQPAQGPRQKTSEISGSRSNYGLVEISSSGPGDMSSSSSQLARLHEHRMAAADIEEEQVIGFEPDMAALLGSLMEEEPQRRCVVSIVGMGGAGKTTLALKLYNSPSAKDHFKPNVAGVRVSQTYSVK